MEKATLWQKDGKWHTVERYLPTAADRQYFPVSYPPNSIGPFYIWTKESYDSEEEALASY